MNQRCGACRQPIADGQTMRIVTDAAVFNGGEVDHGNTDYYHTECVTISPR